MYHLWDWVEGAYFTTFIVGARYVTVLHNHVPATEIIEAVLELVGTKDRVPFVILNSYGVSEMESVFLDNDLAEITLGY